MRNLLLILVAIVLGSFGQVFMKKGMMTFGSVTLTTIWSQLVRILTIPYVLMGFAFFGVSAILWLVVVSRNDLSYAYPMVSLGYVLVLLASAFFFKENISLVRVLGVALICAGVCLVSKS